MTMGSMQRSPHTSRQLWLWGRGGYYWLDVDERGDSSGW